MLETKFLDTNFINPIVIPSGIIPEIPDSLRGQVVQAGGVVTKSITVLAREGNPMPRVIRYECGVLNSVGLRNPGLPKALPLLKQVLQDAKNTQVIISVFAASVADFKKLVEEVVELNPKFIELNLSCPNTVNELGEPLGTGVESTASAVKAVRKISKKVKLIAKLSPNVGKISEIAKAAEAAGADAISAINTVGPGMVIDIETGKPLLGNKEGGVSGPGIRPIAIRCVYDIYKAVKIPILGMGGLETGKDVIEMLMAGATLVGVGSAIYRHGYGVIKKINDEVEVYMQKKKIKQLTELVGLAHR